MRLIALGCVLCSFAAATAADPYAATAEKANAKLVKLFGAGGFRGAESFGTGVIISPEGHVLTAAAPFLDGRELRLHLPDGRKVAFKVKVIEPEFDAAVLEIVPAKKDAAPLDVEFFDVKAEAAKMNVQTGDWVMALSNMYNVATRDEMLSVQRAMVTAVGKLTARRGAFEVPFHGDVFYLDTITNNPGSAGGALVTRKGDLIGLIGKEFRNTQTDTWVNYAMPLNTKADVTIKGVKKTYTLAEFADLAIQGKWIKSERPEPKDTKGPTAYTGIVFVPRVVERTPPYIEQVDSNSPAARAGLKPDDLVIYFDGEPVYSTDTFRDLLKRYGPGDKVQIEIRRGDKLTAISLDLLPIPKR